MVNTSDFLSEGRSSNLLGGTNAPFGVLRNRQMKARIFGYNEKGEQLNNIFQSILGWQEMVTLVWQEENKRGFCRLPQNYYL